eukprot:Awhi_evm1s13885
MKFVEFWEETFVRQKILRVTHATDVIPHYPLQSMGYNHFGNELWFDKRNNIESRKYCEK